MDYRILFFLMASAAYATEVEQARKNVFAQEPAVLKQSGDDAIKNSTLARDLTCALKSRQSLSPIDRLYGQLAIESGVVAWQPLEGYYVEATKALELFIMVKQLADQCNVVMPLIVVGLGPYAQSVSFTKNFSLLFLGTDLISQLSQAGLRAVIAHELGHIKYQHMTKRLMQEHVLPWVIDHGSLALCVLSAGSAVYEQDVKTFFDCVTSAAVVWLIARAVLELSTTDPAVDEQEADQFACQLVGPQAFIQSLKWLEAKVLREKKEFEDRVALRKAQKIPLSRDEQKAIEAMRKSYAWVLYGKNTTPHPSIRERINYAEQFSAQAPCQIMPDHALLAVDQQA